MLLFIRIVGHKSTLRRPLRDLVHTLTVLEDQRFRLPLHSLRSNKKTFFSHESLDSLSLSTLFLLDSSSSSSSSTSSPPPYSPMVGTHTALTA